MFLDILKIIILGIIEGITEWLPVSSTGHLILFGEILKPNLSTEFMAMFNVVIQLGAIMAVVVLYFHKLNPFSPKKNRKQKIRTWHLWIRVIIACIPGIILGFLFDDVLDKYLYKPVVVAIMLILVGAAFIYVEMRNEEETPTVTKLSQLTPKILLIIGLAQALALIPGTSRSGATIIAALLIGVSRPLATEFTFFMAIPMMFGASALKLIKFGLHFSAFEVVCLFIGCIVAFVFSVFAISFLMNFIKKHDFKGFGYYRIVLGVLILVVMGVKSFM
jgi:undecaprenyl-diphosphatase